MLAVGESEVRLRLPPDVEPFRLLPPGVVVVGRAEGHRHRQPRRDVHAGQRDVAHCLPRRELHRRLPSQRLLDRRRDERAVLPHRIQLLRVRQQRERQRPDQPVRRTRPCRHQQS